MKNFNDWNQKKTKIHERKKTPFCHERELWWCALGVNIGFEQDGTGREYYRPVLILKSFSLETCLIAPLTTSTRVHLLRPSVGEIDGKLAHALISQIRVIDTKRLIRKIGYLDKYIFKDIRKAVKQMI